MLDISFYGAEGVRIVHERVDMNGSKPIYRVLVLAYQSGEWLEVMRLHGSQVLPVELIDEVGEK